MKQPAQWYYQKEGERLIVVIAIVVARRFYFQRLIVWAGCVVEVEVEVKFFPIVVKCTASKNACGNMVDVTHGTFLVFVSHNETTVNVTIMPDSSRISMLIGIRRLS